MLTYNETHCLGDRWCDGILLEGSLRPIMLSWEAVYREQRSSIKQFDEVLETFRQHAYSLRRLILNGSNDKSLDMLRMYFQVQLVWFLPLHARSLFPVRDFRLSGACIHTTAPHTERQQ